MLKLIENKEVMKKWDWQKNEEIGLNPNILTCGSNKKAWWVCPKGHSFFSNICNVALENGSCPVCLNRTVVKGINDLESQYPQLLLDWNYEKNAGLDPSSISVGSYTKAYWKCHVCGYEWYRRVRDSVDAMVNCPVCVKKVRAEHRRLHLLEKSGGIVDEKLLLDWDYEKNELRPENVAPQSNKFAFWKCHVCGYEWTAKINNRSNGRGCPLCSNKTVVPGKNDLATTHPELAKEWHPTKNGDLKPTDVTYGCGKKVWWLCPNGHEYRTAVLHRTVGIGTGCPICCSGRQTSFAEQAIFFYVSKLFSDAINRFKSDALGNFELDIYIPSIKTAIEYDGMAFHKTDKHDREVRKYKKCQENGIKLIRLKEKLSEKDKYTADQILYAEETWVSENLNKVIADLIYRLPKQDDIEPQINVNVLRDESEIRSNIIMFNYKKSLGNQYPRLVSEWNNEKNAPLSPFNVYPNTARAVWWKCSKCGETYQMRIEVKSRGGKCPFCETTPESRAKKRMDTLLNKNGSIVNPLLLNEWNYEKNEALSPSMFTKNSKTSVWWKCSKCGYEWKARISNREHGRGCPKCAGRKLIPGYNDLKTANPKLLEEWDYEKNEGVDPSKTHCGSNTSVWWKCSKCGYEYKAPIARRAAGSGCRKCADKANPELKRNAIIQNHGSLGEVCPNLIPDYSPENELSIFEITSGSDKKVKWICSVCGFKWEATPSSRKSGRGCPKCSGNILIPGFNDLKTVHPKLVEEWDYEKNEGLDPSTMHCGSSTSVWWKCSKCGYEYKAPIARRANGSGCRKCSYEVISEQKRKTFIQKRGSLGEICPDLISEYSPENERSISDITSSSGVKVKWICSVCGFKWEATPASRKAGRGCPVCGRKKSAESRKKKKADLSN